MPETLTEDELPLDPDEFVDRFFGMVDGYIDARGWDDARFDEEMSPEEMRSGLYTRVYNEIRTGDIARQILDGVDERGDGQLFIHLCKQVEDEARHARMLAARLEDLGGNPSEALERGTTGAFYAEFDGLDTLEKSVLLQGVGERLASYRHPKELEYYDEETAEIYERVIAPEEKFHAKIGVNLVRQFCTDHETQLTALRQWERARDIVQDRQDEGVRRAYQE